MRGLRPHSTEGAGISSEDDAGDGWRLIDETRALGQSAARNREGVKPEIAERSESFALR